MFVFPRGVNSKVFDGGPPFVKLSTAANFPPHQGSGAGIAIKGDAWVSGWYPAATELNILKKAYTSQKTR